MKDLILSHPEIADFRGEIWLCAGQSNIQKGWREFATTEAEKLRLDEELARLDKAEIFFWDFNDDILRRITRENALDKSALGISFAIRRAESSNAPVLILYVAAGGAPTESFLSRATMMSVDAEGHEKYPHLAAIARNPNPLDSNADFPCTWVSREYPKCKNNLDEGRWWPVSEIYENAISRLRGIKLTGILWYQGESNATTCETPDRPTPQEYQRETLLAIVDELRGDEDVLFLMIGLPVMDRPWEQYREIQRQVCAEKGAIFLDSFAAGLGEFKNVHPRDKVAFADLAANVAEIAITKKGAL